MHATLDRYTRTLLMARYRQLKPHVAVHGAPQHDKLFWLRSAVMSLLPWAVLLFALLAVLSRADIFLMLLLCMVLRVASGTARAKKGVRDKEFVFELSSASPLPIPHALTVQSLTQCAGIVEALTRLTRTNRALTESTLWEPLRTTNRTLRRRSCTPSRMWTI